MNSQSRCLIHLGATALLAASLPAAAANGLEVFQPEMLWPQWQARIAVQTAALSPVTLAGRPFNDGNAAASRGLQGGALFGDYYFARPAFGAFRASGGLLIGAQGGAPVFSFASQLGGARVDLSVNSLGAAAPHMLEAASFNTGMNTTPYLGLGFTGAAWRSLAITADVGLVAERLSAANGAGRVLFGNQGMDNALRDMRLSPVLQLGLRYTF